MIEIFLFIFLFTVLFLFFRPKKLEKDPFELKEMTTIIKCKNCEYKTKRDFKKGDFVSKTLDNCKLCGGTLKISKIFSTQITEEEKKWEKIKRQFD